MPLYELLSISKVSPHHSNRMAALREVMCRTARCLFRENALIRDIKYIGTKNMPYRMKASGEYQTEGSYWLIFFYGGAQSIKRLRRAFEADEDILRCTITKKGDTLKDYVFN